MDDNCYAWGRAATGSEKNARKRLGYFWFQCLYVGVELTVMVPVVQCTPTDMARSHVATDPPTLFRLVYFGTLLTGQIVALS